MGLQYVFDLHFDDLRASMAENADSAVLAGMQFMHGQVSPLVPVETGDLAGSADVGLGRVGIGGPVAGEHVAHLFYPGPYALYQHEGIYFRRPATFGNKLTHTHGESFFLIRPMLSSAEAAIDIVRQRLGL